MTTNLKLDDEDTVEEADASANGLLMALAEKNGVQNGFKDTNKKKLPHTLISPKNKSNESITIRALFSHFNHPGKEYGLKIGRAIGLLIKLAKDILPTWAILKTTEV